MSIEQELFEQAYSEATGVPQESLAACRFGNEYVGDDKLIGAWLGWNLAQPKPAPKAVAGTSLRNLIPLLGIEYGDHTIRSETLRISYCVVTANMWNPKIFVDTAHYETTDSAGAEYIDVFIRARSIDNGMLVLLADVHDKIVSTKHAWPTLKTVFNIGTGYVFRFMVNEADFLKDVAMPY